MQNSIQPLLKCGRCCIQPEHHAAVRGVFCCPLYNHAAGYGSTFSFGLWEQECPAEFHRVCNVCIQLFRGGIVYCEFCCSAGVCLERAYLPAVPVPYFAPKKRLVSKVVQSLNPNSVSESLQAVTALRQKLYIIIYYCGVLLVLLVNWSNGIQLGIFVFVGDVLVFHFGKKIIVERIGYGNLLVEHIFHWAVEHPVCICP